ncbi:MAG: ribonuclease Z [Candidatus Altiarchaeota archaeon]
MKIIFLGTSGAVPTKERNLSSIFLEYLGNYFLFDCGEGTQRQMLNAKINFMRINHIFISHLHADHFLGLGGLIQSMNFLDRKKELCLYGPKGFRKTMEHMLSMGTFILNSFSIKVHEISGGIVLEDDRYLISAIKNSHNINSLAYKFEEKPKRKFLKEKALKLGIPEGPLFSKLQKGKEVIISGRKISPDEVLSEPIQGRKVVYSGDTKFCKELIEFAKNADVLIHESTFSENEREKADDSGHSTAKDAATIAKEANVKKLFLTHISQRYVNPEILEKEAREIFHESYIAKDFLKIKIEKHDI